MPMYDAIIIGSGPNGLAAGITLARAGLTVAIFEREATIGGGLRSAELTLPGFIHDRCSAIHPLGVGSPFFRSLPLDQFGLKWIDSPAPLAHPFDAAPAALLELSLEATSQTLIPDGAAYNQMMKPLVKHWQELTGELLAPLHIPKHPLLLARFGLLAIQSASGLCQRRFGGEAAKGMFAGLAAHSVMPLNKPLTSAFALILGMLGHAVGWPFPEGGSQNIATALASYFQTLGGKIYTDAAIKNIDELPPARAILCDIGPRELIKVAGHRLPPSFVRSLQRYRYGPGAFKIDWALHSPIPWKDQNCFRAATLHLGGTLEEIAQSEAEVWEGKHSKKPLVLLAQQSLFDPTRAPPGKQTAWAYCHVPHDSTVDMTTQIEAQIERFAPGFRDCILARSSQTATDLEKYNPNNVGGDITGGVMDLFQLFTRPTCRLVPYSTPLKNLYLCSALDASWRRCPWPMRLLRCLGCLETHVILLRNTPIFVTLYVLIN